MRSNYAHELAGLLPADVKHPSPRDLEAIQDMVDSRKGRQRDLSRLLAKLEGSAMSFSATHRCQPTNFSIHDSIARSGILFAPVPDFTDPEIMDRHTKRAALVREIIGNSTFPAQLEDGGIKSQCRVEEKIRRKLGRLRRDSNFADFIYLQDASRLRVIADTFSAVDELYVCVHDALQGYSFRQVGFINRYAANTSSYTKSWRGISSSWVLETPREEHPADRIATEVQFVTRRVYSLMTLNHAFDVSKVCKYPTPQHRDWLYRGLCKASILDLEEFLRESGEDVGS